MPVEQWAGASILLYVLYLLLVYFLTNSADRAYRPQRITQLIVVVALLFRIAVLWMPPALSDDLYRYRWEGMLQAAGGNPYATAPDDAQWTSLRDSTYDRIPVKDYPAGYGPLILLAERATFAVARVVSDDPFQQAMVFKIPAIAGDLAVLWLLIGWLDTRRRSRAWLSVYALCPLPILEFWGMGHNDSLAIAFLVAGFWALELRKDGLGFLALGAAVAVKWWPALLLPVAIGYSMQTPRRMLLAALGLLLVPVAFLPYWTDISLNAKFMGGFAGGWRNNDSLFGITYLLSGEDFEIAKRWTLRMIGIWCLSVPFLFPSRDRAALAALAGTLLLAANCHPWYLTWLLPFLVFVPWQPLLLWVGLAPLFYEVLIQFHLLGIWEGSRPGRWLVYGPVFVAMAGWAMRRARGPASTTAPPASSITAPSA